MKDENFINALRPNVNEKAAWETFEKVVKGFISKERAEKYVQNINELLEKYHNLGWNMSCLLYTSRCV